MKELIVLGILLSCLGCSFNSGHDIIPQRYVLVDSNDIKTVKGITYVNGESFSGWLYSVYPSGDTSYLQSFSNGREHGLLKRWYSNKGNEEVRSFINGKKEGKHEGWWENGNRKYEYYFVNDLYEGEIKEWFNDGKPYKIFHYAKGHENGLQRVWEYNGKIRSNYEIKNGRLYGLMGPKPCASVWESDSTVVQSH